MQNVLTVYVSIVLTTIETVLILASGFQLGRFNLRPSKIKFVEEMSI